MSQRINDTVEHIRKLNLSRGDILVLSAEAARWFSMIPPSVLESLTQAVGCEIPVIVGDASKLSREDIVAMLEHAPE